MLCPRLLDPNRSSRKCPSVQSRLHGVSQHEAIHGERVHTPPQSDATGAITTAVIDRQIASSIKTCEHQHSKPYGAVDSDAYDVGDDHTTSSFLSVITTARVMLLPSTENILAKTERLRPEEALGKQTQQERYHSRDTLCASCESQEI